MFRPRSYCCPQGICCNRTQAPSKRQNHCHHKHHRHHHHCHCRSKKSKKNDKRNRGLMRWLRLQLLAQVSGSILGIDHDMEDEDGGEAKKKKDVGSDVEFREIDARGFGVLLFLTWKRRYSDTMDCCTSKQNPIAKSTRIADEMDVSNWPRILTMYDIKDEDIDKC
ncbi:hypothetical protein ACH5RR_006004 [Cinchona calisaya]|uniref:Uncharacterized protein n=1 Tax=Cinchona calisaya TaxID=153742 RepID=A0ABD3AMS2_9GENT